MYSIFSIQRAFKIIYQLLLLLSCISRVWPCASHKRQPTRLLCPWDSPGKNTGVGCHFFPQCMDACYVASVVSDSVWPHGEQPTRLPCPQDSPGKNSGVGCHFLSNLAARFQIRFLYLILPTKVQYGFNMYHFEIKKKYKSSILSR